MAGTSSVTLRVQSTFRVDFHQCKEKNSRGDLKVNAGFCKYGPRHRDSALRIGSNKVPLRGGLLKNFQCGRCLNCVIIAFLLVDLRCHGDSASIPKRPPHTVASAARDVLQLVWVLDATPGKVRSGGDGEDRPAELIAALRQMPKQVASKRFVIDALVPNGFSVDVAQWITTNLRPGNSDGTGRTNFSWNFDLEGISDMYKSYEDTNLWQVVENVPQGVHVDFLRAERSLHRWAHEDIQRIHAAEELAASEGAGVQMHVLEDAGHWVHADNPDGLFRILASSFTRFNR